MCLANNATAAYAEIGASCSEIQLEAQKTDDAPRRIDQAAASENDLAPEIKLLSYILNSSINYPSEPRGISLIHKISDTSNL